MHEGIPTSRNPCLVYGLFSAFSELRVTWISNQSINYPLSSIPHDPEFLPKCTPNQAYDLQVSPDIKRPAPFPLPTPRPLLQPPHFPPGLPP